MKIQQLNSRFMSYKNLHFTLFFFCTLIQTSSIAAQSWNFIKEKDGIKIYTRTEEGKSLKSYRGVTRISSSAETIFAVLEDINDIDWWDKNLTQMKVLLNEKNKRMQYYFVYNSPWPVTDRDLCVEVSMTKDTVTGERKINAFALNGVIPERKNMDRIKDYWQTWIITPTGQENSDVVLEGFVDPAGNIPAWIANMLIIETPIKAIKGLKDKMGEK
jgi:hypothetical protein